MWHMERYWDPCHIHVPNRSPQHGPVALRDVHVSHRTAKLGPGALCDVQVPHQSPQLGQGPLSDAPYMSVLLLIRPKKPVMAQHLSLHPMMSLTMSVMSQYLFMSPISSLAPSEWSFCVSAYLMVSQNILKMCIISFWISQKLEKFQFWLIF
jgi:hypothetical protein